jgi:hypothetical protein
MNWPFAGMLLVLSFLPVMRGASQTQSAQPNPGPIHPGSHRPVRHEKVPNHSSARMSAKLLAVSFSPPARPQSDSSLTRASSKKKSTKKKRPSHREPTQMTPTRERISEIQSALAHNGYYKTDPTGQWDSDTVDALEKFQSAKGLDVTGKLDALTLQKLGLGSDVAGVSAPKGIVSHSCCSISPSPSHAPPASASPSSASPNSSGPVAPTSAAGSSPAETQHNDSH